MELDFVKYVHRHPPRCVAGLSPVPTQRHTPTLKLPPHETVYHPGNDDPDIEAYFVSFLVGCECGHKAVYLLGYYEPRDKTGLGEMNSVGAR